MLGEADSFEDITLYGRYKQAWLEGDDLFVLDEQDLGLPEAIPSRLRPLLIFLTPVYKHLFRSNRRVRENK